MDAHVYTPRGMHAHVRGRYLFEGNVFLETGPDTSLEWEGTFAEVSGVSLEEDEDLQGTFGESQASSQHETQYRIVVRCFS